MHPVPDARAYLPLPQKEHDVAPGLLAYLPAAHGVQLVDRSLLLDLPTGQLMQSSAVAPVLLENDPGKQPAQKDCPAYVYVPGSHCLHSVAPAYPE